MATYKVVTSAYDLPAIAQEIRDSKIVAADTETTALDPWNGKIRLLSVNTGRNIYVIDAFQTKTLDPVLPALAEDGHVSVWQNLKFDQKWCLYHYDVEFKKIFDTYRASVLIHNGKGMGHDLWDLYRRELGISPEVGDYGASDWAGILSKGQLDYAADDVEKLPRLREKLIPQLRDLGLFNVAKIEFDVILPEAAMELAGMLLDKEKWLRLAESKRKLAEEYREKVEAGLPHPKGQLGLFGPAHFNISSPPQLLQSLARLGIKTKSTDVKHLAPFVAEYPIIGDLVQYKKFLKCWTAFGPDYLRHICAFDGRIHSQYFPFTGAGRYSSSRPNLQQVPHEPAYRECFVASEGKRILARDYSQVEIRLVGEQAGDKRIIQAYKDGVDIHSLTASLVNSKPIELVTKHDRQAAKPVNFGLIYGLGPYKLILMALADYGVAMTVKQAKEFRFKYFESYSDVKKWQERIEREVIPTRMTRTASGRLRYILSELERNAFFNTPIQGTGADGMKRAMRLAYDKFRKYNGAARIIHTVHDELLTEVPDDDEMVRVIDKDFEDAMIEGMAPFLPRIPVEVSRAEGYCWVH